MRSLSFTRTIGAGAFGTVYLAELVSGKSFRRPVAVKVLNRDRPDSEEFLARFRDEARLLGLLQDDAILKVLDMVQIEGADAVVMEYIEGTDLDTLVKAGHRPGLRALAEIGGQVAGALSRAHRAIHPSTRQPLNVVHRDVKPANMMITSVGVVKLLDFGVARARFDARESFTGHMVLGTLNYMAPEYIVTGEVTSAADVYGLALSMWQAAIGEPFGQPKTRQDGHEKRVVANLERLKPAYTPLVPLLRRMLVWNPAERPDAAEVERTLMDLADQAGGPSARSWAQPLVTAILTQRHPAADTASLVGRTVPIQSSQGAVADAPLLGEDVSPLSVSGNRSVPTPAPAAAAPPVVLPPAPPPSPAPPAPRPAAPARPPVFVPSSASPEVGTIPLPRPEPPPRPVAQPAPRPAPPPRPPSPSGGSLLPTILKGALLGIGLGLLVLGVLVVVLIVR
jgi:serine/threonine-protein kinase